MVAFDAPKAIYFIRAREVGMIKIGCSQRPDSRFRAHKLVSPVPLELILTTPGTHEDEWHIHATFRENRVYGEWFRTAPEIEAMIEHLRQGTSLSAIIGPSPGRHDRHFRPAISRARVDKNAVKAMLSRGVQPSNIARQMCCSRQYVSLIKKMEAIMPRRKRRAST